MLGSVMFCSLSSSYSQREKNTQLLSSSHTLNKNKSYIITYIEKVFELKRNCSQVHIHAYINTSDTAHTSTLQSTIQLLPNKTAQCMTTCVLNDHTEKYARTALTHIHTSFIIHHSSHILRADVTGGCSFRTRILFLRVRTRRHRGRSIQPLSITLQRRRSQLKAETTTLSSCGINTILA